MLWHKVTSWWIIVVVALAVNAVSRCALSQPATELGNTDQSTIGDAFQTLFVPSGTPQLRKMGLIQRTNLVDSLLAPQGRLELAIVVDGTESMTNELRGIQARTMSMIQSIRSIIGDKLFVQIVVYRDTGSPSGSIEWPLKVQRTEWTNDDDVIRGGLEKLKPETGAPYFHELVDVGLFDALSDLKWSTVEDQNIRWLFLIGDAPPFPEEFNQPENKAKREYSTEVIKNLAIQKKIQISTFLCQSREEDEPAYREALDDTKKFFEEIASTTGGQFFNFSDTRTQQELRIAAARVAKRFVKFDEITQREIDDYRNRSTVTQNPNAKTPLRIAVLPFLEDGALPDFGLNNSMTKLAEELRSQLDGVGVDVPSLIEVEDAVTEFKRRNGTANDMPQYVGKYLDVTHVVWGKAQGKPSNSLTSIVYDVQKGQTVATTDLITVENAKSNLRLCSAILQSFALKSKGTKDATVAGLISRKFATRLVSTSPEEVADSLQSARLMLAQTLKGESLPLRYLDPAAGPQVSLEQVKNKLESLDPDTRQKPDWNILMANVSFSLANQHLAAGENGKARSFKREAENLGQTAYDTREQAAPVDQKEIEGDFHFFRGDYAKASEIYEEIVSNNISHDNVVAAHWMLVWIYAGDWGVSTKEPGLVNLSKARSHAFTLMADYPNRPETQALKQALRWDDTEKKTLLPFLPLSEDLDSDSGQN